MTQITPSRPGTLGRILLCSTGVLGCCLLAAACGAGTTGATASSNGRAVLGVRAAPGTEGRPASLPASGSGQATAGGSIPGIGKAAVATAHLAPAGQSIIYTASLKMRAANVMAAAKQAVAVATAAGGYVADEQAVSGPSGKPHGSVLLTLKIPVPSYQTVLAQLSSAAIGKQLALQQQATDVTQQVADVTSLVTSQQDAISALRGLLKRAGSVSGLLQVQQQISSDQSNLNSLLAQQRALNRETSYATVSMTLVSAPARVHHHRKPVRRGFLAGLTAGWRAMRHSAAWVATAVGVLLPFLIVAVLLAAAGYVGRRRYLRRRAAS